MNESQISGSDRNFIENEMRISARPNGKAQLNDGAIPKYYSDLRMQIDILRESILELTAKLKPVLLPDFVQRELEGEKQMPAASELAMSIYRDTEQIKSLQTTVGDLIRRIEL